MAIGFLYALAFCAEIEALKNYLDGTFTYKKCLNKQSGHTIQIRRKILLTDRFAKDELHLRNVAKTTGNMFLQRRKVQGVVDNLHIDTEKRYRRKEFCTFYKCMNSLTVNKIYKNGIDCKTRNTGKSGGYVCEDCFVKLSGSLLNKGHTLVKINHPNMAQLVNRIFRSEFHKVESKMKAVNKLLLTKSICIATGTYMTIGNKHTRHFELIKELLVEKIEATEKAGEFQKEEGKISRKVQLREFLVESEYSPNISKLAEEIGNINFNNIPDFTGQDLFELFIAYYMPVVEIAKTTKDGDTKQIGGIIKTFDGLNIEESNPAMINSYLNTVKILGYETADLYKKLVEYTDIELIENVDKATAGIKICLAKTLMCAWDCFVTLRKDVKKGRFYQLDICNKSELSFEPFFVRNESGELLGDDEGVIVMFRVSNATGESIDIYTLLSRQLLIDVLNTNDISAVEDKYFVLKIGSKESTSLRSLKYAQVTELAKHIDPGKAIKVESYIETDKDKEYDHTVKNMFFEIYQKRKRLSITLIVLGVLFSVTLCVVAILFLDKLLSKMKREDNLKVYFMKNK